MKRNYKAGIWFWTGAGVYSLINIILNYRQVVQSKVLNYNFIIFGAAIIGFILNFTLSKRNK